MKVNEHQRTQMNICEKSYRYSLVFTDIRWRSLTFAALERNVGSSKKSRYSTRAFNLDRNNRASLAMARQTLEKMRPLLWAREPSASRKSALNRCHVAYFIVLDHNSWKLALCF
jgi:hypothetical protein